MKFLETSDDHNIDGFNKIETKGSIDPILKISANDVAIIRITIIENCLFLKESKWLHNLNKFFIIFIFSMTHFLFSD